MTIRRNQILIGGWIVVGLALVVGVLATTDDDPSDRDDVVAEAAEPSTTTSPSTTVASSEVPTTPAPIASDDDPDPDGGADADEDAPASPEEQLLPDGAEALAAALTEAEASVRSVDLDREEIAAWGRRQQRLYRQLSNNPDWADDVIEAVDPRFRLAVEQNWAARQNLSFLVNSVELSDTLPAWRIRDPLPAEELFSFYQEAEVETGVPWAYLAAINLIETRMGRIEGLSTAGATGPMQFLPSTWAECCEGDPTDDRDAIVGAATYLAIRGAPADMEAAVRGYNTSSNYVAAVQAYVTVLEDDPAAYLGYHAWEVYFLSSAGLIRLPTGYDEPEPVDAATWLDQNPEAATG